jgi:PhoPQ-activated pathogenicity-related protein
MCRKSIYLIFLILLMIQIDSFKTFGRTSSGMEVEALDSKSNQDNIHFDPCNPDVLTALDSYVAAPDASYTWNQVREISSLQYMTYILDMTSQTWLTSAEVDWTRWRHWVRVIIPNNVSSTTAFLWITGGNNNDPQPTSPNSDLAMLANKTKTVVAEVRMVPNQPLRFTGDSLRWEDALIAYCWDKFLTTGEEIWVTRLPMTKSAVRAMDAVEEFCASPAGGSLTIENFVVAGASKRGWTTWTTAAVDSRVIAIAPVVIDILNVERSMSHHWAAYGFWATAVGDYEDMGIMDWLATPEFEALMAITDPYSYRARYTMPKFIINSSGDDFFVPDSSQFYFDDLPGEKYLLYVPNTDHFIGGSGGWNLDGSDIWNSMLAFYESIVNEWSRPQFSWTLEGDGSIRVQTVDTPNEVNLWQTTNPSARDFRKNPYPAQGHPQPTPVWYSSPLSDLGGGVYVAQVNEPPAGWTAFFVELIYDSGGTKPYKFTTEINVIPYYLPFACDFDHSGDIDLVDLDVFADQWLQTGELSADVAPKGGDGAVDFLDFVTFGRNWSP